VVIKYNFHTHSLFSDGSDEPEAYVLQAIKQGFSALGFSEHSPLPIPNTFALKETEAVQYVRVIRALQARYQDKISVFAGMEMDYIPGYSEGFAAKAAQWGLDYVIGSVHLVVNEAEEGLWFIDGPQQHIYDDGLQQCFGGDIRKAVGAYYAQLKRMVQTEEFSVVGHLDKVRMHNKNRYFREDESWYQALILDLLDEIAKRDIIVEANTRGLYKKRADDLFPSKWILAEILKRDIPVMLSSDAHKPEEISLMMAESYETLLEIGFTEEALNMTHPIKHGFPQDPNRE